MVPSKGVPVAGRHGWRRGWTGWVGGGWAVGGRGLGSGRKRG